MQKTPTVPFRTTSQMSPRGVAGQFSRAEEIAVGIRQMAEQYRALVQRLQAMDLQFD